jgi:hypothetical protein
MSHHHPAGIVGVLCDNPLVILPKLPMLHFRNALLMGLEVTSNF